MRTLVTVFGAVALLGCGYVMGSTNLLSPTVLLAQGDDEKKPAKADESKEGAEGSALTEETRAKIKAAADALNAAMEALKQEGLYTSATRGMNVFSILTGGGNSLKDLESGRGVDPETFAALYADMAIDELAEKLGRDQEQRLTFNGKVIRMYPVSRLKSLYMTRAAITGEELFPKPTEDETKKLGGKKKPEGDDEK